MNDTLGLVAAVAGVIAAAGDPGQIWITEVGVKATPAAQPVAPATASEAFQAAWLRDLFTALATTHAGRVAHAFWFKFEDFPPSSPAETWGLAQLRPGPTAGGYDPGGAVQRASRRTPRCTSWPSPRPAPGCSPRATRHPASTST